LEVPDVEGVFGWRRGRVEIVCGNEGRVCIIMGGVTGGFLLMSDVAASSRFNFLYASHQEVFSL
jgi:hypothetical protein